MTSDIHAEITIRRLSLCKQLYLHGERLSRQLDPLSKMIAVHNMHNSIELFLRSLFLSFSIRPEKQLNIDFESMLSEVDSAEVFKSAGKKIPYRAELRNLNQLRNHVQHHAIEPEESSMDYWRTFSRQFLAESFLQYYDLDFATFSMNNLLGDDILRHCLQFARAQLKENNLEKAVSLAALAFELSAFGFHRLTPNEGLQSSFFLTSGMDFQDPLRKVVEGIYKRIDSVEHYAIFLSSGITARELKEYESSAPSVMFAIVGYPHFGGFRTEVTPEKAEWVCDFVERNVLHWQTIGFSPTCPEHFREQISAFLTEYQKPAAAEPIV